MKIKRVITLVILVTVAGVAGFASTDNSPSNAAIDFAQRTSNLMVNELVAALFQELNETTPDNVEEGKQSISLIFNDSNRDMRLIGSFGPLQRGDTALPSDPSEQTALSQPLEGQAHPAGAASREAW